MLYITLLVIVDFALLANVLLPQSRPIPQVPASRFAEVPETYQTLDTETVWVSDAEIAKVVATKKVLNSGPATFGGFWVTLPR